MLSAYLRLFDVGRRNLLAVHFRSMASYTRAEVDSHDAASDLWAVISGYVVDLTDFARHHPAGAQKIIARRQKNVDITSNFVDHFGHTVRAFREACREFDEKNETVILKFPEATEGQVRIVGRFTQ
mmetsp:Transcript_22125/g.46677  ORF Transcript_22125/g.46677 Transcript_22125/m.46677 type:complete len:126 (-) Transcript_22125:196-573(-)